MLHAHYPPAWSGTLRDESLRHLVIRHKEAVITSIDAVRNAIAMLAEMGDEDTSSAQPVSALPHGGLVSLGGGGGNSPDAEIAALAAELAQLVAEQNGEPEAEAGSVVPRWVADQMAGRLSRKSAEAALPAALRDKLKQQRYETTEIVARINFAPAHVAEPDSITGCGKEWWKDSVSLQRTSFLLPLFIIHVKTVFVLKSPYGSSCRDWCSATETGCPSAGTPTTAT